MSQSGGGWAQEHWDFTASPLWGSKGDDGWPEVLAGVGGGASGGALMVAGDADSISAEERPESMGKVARMVEGLERKLCAQGIEAQRGVAGSA